MRVLASAPSNLAFLFVTAPKAYQLVPLFFEYHQLPFVVLAAVTPMPSLAPASESVTLSTCPAGTAKSTRADTSVPTAPEGAPVFWLSGASTGLLEAFNTGEWMAAIASSPATATMGMASHKLARNLVVRDMSQISYKCWIVGRTWAVSTAGSAGEKK